MKRFIPKSIVIPAIILLMAFAGITLLKYLRRPRVIPSLADSHREPVSAFWTYFNQATKYRLQGKADSSIIAYQKALKLNPQHEDALYYLGTMYEKADQLAGARETWVRLTELDPKSDRAFNQLGRLYFCINHPDYFHPEISRRYYQRAQDLNKEAFNANIRLGEIALFQNRIRDASLIFQNLSRMDRKDGEVYFILGYLKWKSPNQQDALRDIQKALAAGGSGLESRSKSTLKNQGCDLFGNWMAGNLKDSGSLTIRKTMQDLYRDFDRYLGRMRARLHPD